MYSTPTTAGTIAGVFATRQEALEADPEIYVLATVTDVPLIFGTETQLRDRDELSEIEQREGCLLIVGDEVSRTRTSRCDSLAALCENVLLIGGEPVPTPGCDLSEAADTSASGDETVGANSNVDGVDTDEISTEAEDGFETLELVGQFEYMAGGEGRTITQNEVTVTVTSDGAVSGEGTIVQQTLVEVSGCRYDNEYQVDIQVSGALTDTPSESGGVLVDLELTSDQRYNYVRTQPIDPDDDRECVNRITDPAARTTGTGDLSLGDQAVMTATIEPARPSPFINIPSFEATES